MRTKRDIPVLEGWKSLPTAARELSVTRQRLFQMGAEEDKLTSLRQVPGAGTRPAAYVVSEAELCRLRREQLEAAIRAAQAQEADEDKREAEVTVLRDSLGVVQLDAVRLLYLQLEATADAAAVAGDESLAVLLRKWAADMRVPVAA
jgi:hypothetical protein